jgi:hypothetical protein
MVRTVKEVLEKLYTTSSETKKRLLSLDPYITYMVLKY